ncbi:methyltransferase [Pestalotiopsis sp. NC0098]|nr:methyltransferase [Pestalotiopsis sp. NC0098]
MAITPDPVPRGPVIANINYGEFPAEGKKAINYVEDPPAGEPKRNVEVNSQDTRIEDIRGREADFNLDTDAFAAVRGVPESAERDFADDESIRAKYYPEVEQFLLDHVPGSNRVFLFDHTIRRADPSAKRQAVFTAHIDQTPLSAPQRVRKHLPDEADALLRGRYRIVNVWRSLNKGPVESNPLAFASSSTFSNDDLIPVEHRYPNGYTGQTAAIHYNPSQKWYYWSGMTGNERLMLECFDSEGIKEGSGVKGGRVPHTAFIDPRTRKEAEGRESIEVRALVFGP